METLVPVEVTEVQQWQLRLGGQEQALLIAQLDTGQSGQVLFKQKQDAGFAQPAIFVITDAIEQRQVLANCLPLLGGDRVALQGAPTPPGAERPHGGDQ
ncbi:hypothetical protein D3C81_1969280 [compost metagenome]